MYLFSKEINVNSCNGIFSSDDQFYFLRCVILVLCYLKHPCVFLSKFFSLIYLFSNLRVSVIYLFMFDNCRTLFYQRLRFHRDIKCVFLYLNAIVTGLFVLCIIYQQYRLNNFISYSRFSFMWRHSSSTYCYLFKNIFFIEDNLSSFIHLIGKIFCCLFQLLRIYEEIIWFNIFIHVIYKLVISHLLV